MQKYKKKHIKINIIYCLLPNISNYITFFRVNLNKIKFTYLCCWQEKPNSFLIKIIFGKKI